MEADMKNITFRLSDEVLDILNKVSKETGFSKTSLVSRFIKTCAKLYEKDGKV